MTPQEMYIENGTDQGLREVFHRAEEIRTQQREADVQRMLELQLQIEYNRDEQHERLRELEQKTRQMKARMVLLFGMACGVCAGAGIAALMQGDYVSAIASALIGAALAVGWATIR